MIKKLSAGNQFVLTNMLLFFIFGILLTVFFKNYSITLEQNINYETGIVLCFLLLSLFVNYFIFKKEISNTSKFSFESILNFSILLMLFTTVFNIPVSIVATVFFFLCALIYAIIKKKINKPHPVFYFIFGYYLFQLLGLTWSIDLPNGIKTIDKGISYLLIPLAFCFYVISDETRKKLLMIFFRGIFIFILLGLIGYIFQIYFHHFGLLEGFQLHKNYLHTHVGNGADYQAIMAWTSYGHPTFISFIITLTLGIGYYFHSTDTQSKIRPTKTELGIFVILGFILIIILQSRLGMLMLPSGIFVLLLWGLRENKKWFWSFLTFSGLIATFALIYIYKHYSSYFFDLARDTMFVPTKNHIISHPWLGTGTGGMRKIVTLVANPHDQYYGEILHLGIVGAAVLWTLIGSVFYFAIKNKNVLLLYFIVLILILMLTEMPFSIQKGVTFFTLFVGLFVRPEWRKNKSN